MDTLRVLPSATTPLYCLMASSASFLFSSSRSMDTVGELMGFDWVALRMGRGAKADCKLC